MKFDNKTKKIVLVSLLTAVVGIVTVAIAVPIPNLAGAYVNAGDAAVYVAAYVLGGPWGALCAAVGSALADLVLGSVVYLPATFVIKGAMGYITGRLMGKLPEKKKPLAVFAGGLVMPLGYFLFECLLYGRGAAWAGVLFNLIQYAGGGVLGALAISAVAMAQKRGNRS